MLNPFMYFLPFLDTIKHLALKGFSEDLLQYIAPTWGNGSFKKATMMFWQQASCNDDSNLSFVKKMFMLKKNYLTWH